MASHFIVECLDCGYGTPYFPTSVSCPRCGSGWREALYDYPSLALTMPLQLPGRPFDVWRYKELLPVRDHNPDLTLGEGGTPLLRASNLGNMLKCTNLFVKDERQNPTNSFKDRQAAVTIAALLESGINEMVIASSGNIALAYAAHGARAGIKVWAFLSSRVPADKFREISMYGAKVIKVSGGYEQARHYATEFAKQRNLFLDQASQTVPSVEAMKTIAFEIAEQLTACMGAPVPRAKNKPAAPWRAPNWYIQAVSVGLGPIGVLKGFSELRLMELVEHAPGMGMIQPEGCAPMAQAFSQGIDTVDPILSPTSSIESLITIDPGRAYSLLRNRMDHESGGVFETVTDKETYKAISLMHRLEGISLEPAAGVAFAGLIKLCNKGIIKDKDIVVVNCTGKTTIPDRGIRYIYEKKDSGPLPAPVLQDGLVAQLMKVDFSDSRRVLIAHADEVTRNLLKRYAQYHGITDIIETDHYARAVQVAMTEAPDLIFLDFLSPEINAYMVLDTVFAKNNTFSIPVIAITTDEISEGEKAILREHIDLMTNRAGTFKTSDANDFRSFLE